MFIRLKNIYSCGWLYSACLFNIYNNIYIITINCNFEGSDIDSIKLFDLNGKNIKKINNSANLTYFIDVYFDKRKSKLFIITCNKGYSKSYDYMNNCLYHKYYEENDRNNMHMSAFIYNEEEFTQMIESSGVGNIKIWNFHSGELVKIISVNNEWLYSIGLWEKNYIFVGCKNGEINLIDLNKGIIINRLKSHKEKVLAIKKIYHPKYGEILVSQDLECIKLWINKK